MRGGLERLASFEFEVVHGPGKLHSHVDGWSRCRQCNEELIQENSAKAVQELRVEWSDGNAMSELERKLMYDPHIKPVME